MNTNSPTETNRFVTTDDAAETYDVIVIGGGPAGSSAGVFTARAELDTLILEDGRSTVQKCAYLENDSVRARTMLTSGTLRPRKLQQRYLLQSLNPIVVAAVAVSRHQPEAAIGMTLQLLDFDSQEAVQQVYDGNPSDPLGLR